jgi:RNA polymerase-binding transcription factor
MDPERARARLTEEKGRIEKELADIGNSPAGSDEPEDFGDSGVELDQSGRDAAIREDLRKTLAAIQRAQQRLDEGTYGKSVVSGKPIPEKRLEALPWAERLVEEER